MPLTIELPESLSMELVVNFSVAFVRPDVADHDQPRLVILWQDPDNEGNLVGWWVARCPSLPCTTQGATREEAIEMVREAMSLMIEVLVEDGLPILAPDGYSE